MTGVAVDSTKKIFFRCVFALVCTMLPPIVAGQQASQSPATGETVLRVNTRLVLVDAVVLDKTGKPITNLTENDFTVLEDGKPQKIAAFSVTVHQPIQANAGPPILQPHVTTNRPEAMQMEGAVAVLLLDGLNTPREDQMYVRQQVLKFLANHFDTSYKIAVVALTNKVDMLQDFTSDPKLLKAALDHYVPQMPLLAHNGIGSPGISLNPQAAAMIRHTDEKDEEFKRDLRVPVTLAALQNIARYMSGQHGRKVLLWFSAGFPISVGGGRGGENVESREYHDPRMMVESRDYTDQIWRTTNLLNEAHVAIYSIDARGLSTGGLSTDGASDPKEIFERLSTEDTLERTAVDTGGQYFHARNDIDLAISLSLQESGSYYMLGYYPLEKKWDGKFRQIRVSVDHAGLQVRHRRGYFAVDSQNWRNGGHDKDLSAALAPGTLPSTEVLFMARALPPAGNADVNVEFMVDPATILFQGAEGGQYSNLNFEVQAFTPKGKLVKAEVQKAEGSLLPKTFERVQKQGLSMQVPIKLPVGRYNLRLGVRDNLTGLFGTAELPIEVGTNP